eukprot:TRINITY_DN22697_c0_g1_i1.p1 TRINITY_DN22697_c0_g1~~TRINITY_DN22697_c0_g1_i1.p1  ORF type:complete len:568 (+),score=190.27 TRINITY_DN22697_c0_g1_i1:103-1704(+)
MSGSAESDSEPDVGSPGPGPGAATPPPAAGEATPPPGSAGCRQLRVVKGEQGQIGLTCTDTLVTGVAPGSPAAAAGITPGMCIVGVNGQPVGQGEDARNLLLAAPASFVVHVTDGAPCPPAALPTPGAATPPPPPAEPPEGTPPPPPPPLAAGGAAAGPPPGRGRVEAWEEDEEDEEEEDEEEEDEESEESQQLPHGRRPHTRGIHVDPAVICSRPARGGGGSSGAQPGQLPPEVVSTLARLQADQLDVCVLSMGYGWKWKTVEEHALPLLLNTRNVNEILLMDLFLAKHVTSICEVVARNPTICGLSLVLTAQCPYRGICNQGWEAVCRLVSNCQHLVSLTVQHVLPRSYDDEIQQTGEKKMRDLGLALRSPNCTLRRLDLSYNSIQDQELLHLAQALAANTTLHSIDLRRNYVDNEGLEMMAEVMTFNTTLEEVLLEENYVRHVMDTWEGFFVNEQCAANRELRDLGPYEMQRHHRWPPLWRRKMRRLWYAWRVARLTPGPELWERVLQFMDNRGYVLQNIRLWMKHQPGA